MHAHLNFTMHAQNGMHVRTCTIWSTHIFITSTVTFLTLPSTYTYICTMYVQLKFQNVWTKLYIHIICTTCSTHIWNKLNSTFPLKKLPTQLQYKIAGYRCNFAISWPSSRSQTFPHVCMYVCVHWVFVYMIVYTAAKPDTLGTEESVLISGGKCTC